MRHNGANALFLAWVLCFILIVCSGWASAQDTGKTYVISVENSLNGSYIGGPDMIVNVDGVSGATMSSPLVIMGSGADLEEQRISDMMISGHFEKDRILTDSTDTFNGVNLSGYDLILIGGPNHNAYTKMLMDAGYLKYNVTDKKIPTLIFEAVTVPGGHKVVVIGDAGSYTYHKKDLPLNSIIPEQMAPAAAVTAGFGLGLIGALLSNLPSFSGLISNALNFLSGLVGSHLVEVASEAEVKATKESVRKKEVHYFGISLTEIILAIIVSAILGAAFIYAARELFTLDNILIFFVVAGVTTVVHDLAHKRMALKYKVMAEYKFWTLGTAIMILTSWLFGNVFAQSARTLMEGEEIPVKEEAAIALAGPRVSLQLAGLFFILMVLKFTPWGGIFGTIGALGFSFNLLTAVYSLIPFEPMDGGKIYKLSKLRWALWFVPLLAVYLVATIFVL
jgi:Zn-dependent protease